MERLRLREPVLAGAAVVAGTLALRLRDPHDAGSWGFCPLRALTGLDCPFCGGLRAVNDLTHLDLGAAAASNLFLVASLPLLVGLWGWWLVRSVRRGPPLQVRRAPVTAYLVAMVAFTVVRNTPWGHGIWA